MFQNLAVFRMAQAMAIHAGTKQAVVAQNVANADTPGYVARDIPSFKDLYASQNVSPHVRFATRAGHLHGTDMGNVAIPMHKDRSFASPDGNTVSLETEMLRGVDALREHNRAMAIYKSSLNILRSSLGRQ